MAPVVRGYREFDRLFDRWLVEPLRPAGFRTSGRSLFLDNGLENVSLIRISGKMAGPGCAVWVLGFRHSFLTAMTEPDKRGFLGSPTSYPFCFRPDFLQRTASWRWRFRPYSRLTPLPFRYGGLVWEDRSAAQVERELGSLVRLIQERFLPWCQRLTPRRALRRISWSRGKLWREKTWIEEYRTYLAATEEPRA